MELINTEEKILQSARKIFIQKGYDGTRMQEIADGADINKAMLHYYFRSKDLLYERVFIDYMRKIVPNMNSILENNTLSIFQKIERIISSYIDFLVENPELPSFIIGEVSKRPDFLIKTFQKEENRLIMPFVPLLLIDIEKNIQDGTIKQVNPVHLIVNLMSMCVFPFAAKPMMSIMLKMTDADFHEFIQHRKIEISSFIHQAIAL
ncbi:MAG: TetR/AcrR family transcriptional regulator [Saprospiraceae bacterium]